MLVLSRKRNENVIIGTEIVVCIVDVRGDNVRIGINAPRELPVHHGEVYDAIIRERGQVTSNTCPCCGSVREQ